MNTRIRIAAGAVALAALPAAALAVSPLDESMASLEPMLGKWSVSEKSFAPDGSVVKALEGGIIEFEPALRGTYLFMHADAGNVDPEADPLLWMFCRDTENDRFVARGFQAHDPAPAVAVGNWEGDSLVFIRDPETNVPPLEFRFTITPVNEDEIHAKLELRVEDEWILRSDETWRRIE